MESPVRILLSAALVVHLVLLCTTSAIPASTTTETDSKEIDTSTSHFRLTSQRRRAQSVKETANEVKRKENFGDSDAEEDNESVPFSNHRGTVRYSRKQPTTAKPRRKVSTENNQVTIVTPEPVRKKIPEIIQSMQKYKNTVSKATTPRPTEEVKYNNEFKSHTSNSDYFVPSFHDEFDFSHDEHDQSSEDFHNYGYHDTTPKHRNKNKKSKYTYSTNFDDMILTTPQNDFFDSRFKEISQSISENIEKHARKNSEPKNNFEHRIADVKMTPILNFNRSAHTDPSNSTQMYFRESKSILVSDNEAEGSSLSDVQGTSIYYEQSMLSTESYGNGHKTDSGCDDSPTEETFVPVEIASTTQSTKRNTLKYSARQREGEKIKLDRIETLPNNYSNKTRQKKPYVYSTQSPSYSRNPQLRKGLRVQKPAEDKLSVKPEIVETTSSFEKLTTPSVKRQYSKQIQRQSAVNNKGTNKPDAVVQQNKHIADIKPFITTTETNPGTILNNIIGKLSHTQSSVVGGEGKSDKFKFNVTNPKANEMENKYHYIEKTSSAPVSAQLLISEVENTEKQTASTREPQETAIVTAKPTRRIQYTTPKTRLTYRMTVRKYPYEGNVKPNTTTIYEEHFNIKDKENATEKRLTLASTSSSLDPVFETEISGVKKVVHSHKTVDNSIPKLRKRGSAKFGSASTAKPSSEVSSGLDSLSDLTLPTASSSWGALAGMRNPPSLTSSAANATETIKNLDENELQKVADSSSDNPTSQTSSTRKNNTIISSPTKPSTLEEWKPVYVANNETSGSTLLSGKITEITAKPLDSPPTTQTILTNELTGDSKMEVSAQMEKTKSAAGWIPVNNTDIFKENANKINNDRKEIPSSTGVVNKTTMTYSMSAARNEFESISKIPLTSTQYEAVTPVSITTYKPKPQESITYTTFDNGNEEKMETTTATKNPSTAPTKILPNVSITLIESSDTTTESIENPELTTLTTSWHEASLTDTTKFMPIQPSSNLPVTTYRPSYYTQPDNVETETETFATTTMEDMTGSDLDNNENLNILRVTPTDGVQTSDDGSTSYESNYTTNNDRVALETTTPLTIETDSQTEIMLQTAFAPTDQEITITTEDPQTTNPPSTTDTMLTEFTESTAQDVKPISNATDREVVTTVQQVEESYPTTTEIVLETKTTEATISNEVKTTESTKQTEVTTPPIKETSQDGMKNEDVTSVEVTTVEESTVEITTVRTEGKLEDLTSNIAEDLTTYAPNIGSTAEEPSSAAGVAIAVSTIGVIALLLVIGLLLVLRRRRLRGRRCGVYAQRCTPVSLDTYSLDSSVRRKGTRLRASKRSYGNPAYDDEVVISHPMQYPALASFALNSESIVSEFSEIPSASVRADEVPDGCQDKNRFSNVLPLPETRVPLKRIDGDPTSEYINANYVTGPGNIKNYYIACQAPMANTVTDFWRMIWEQNSRLIVMLTEYMENGTERCYEYLPPSEVTDNKRTFGDLQVTLKRREQFDKYAISSVELRNLSTHTWREVTHLWYFWPATGVPDDYDSVISFLAEMRSYMKISQNAKEFDEDDVAVPVAGESAPDSPSVHVYSPQRAEETRRGMSSNGTLGRMKAAADEKGVRPCVVTCASGAGRTGTLLALDLCSLSLESGGTVDVPRTVRALRAARPHALQNKAQYVFLYKVLSEHGHKLNGGVNSI